MVRFQSRRYSPEEKNNRQKRCLKNILRQAVLKKRAARNFFNSLLFCQAFQKRKNPISSFFKKLMGFIFSFKRRQQPNVLLKKATKNETAAADTQSNSQFFVQENGYAAHF